MADAAARAVDLGGNVAGIRRGLSGAHATGQNQSAREACLHGKIPTIPVFELLSKVDRGGHFVIALTDFRRFQIVQSANLLTATARQARADRN